MDRRSIIKRLGCIFPAIALAPLVAAKAETTGEEIIKSFDARVWAKGFVEHVRNNPSIATDEATMATWFASALMRGYDEHAAIIGAPPETAVIGEDELRAAYTGCVARGWCSDANRHKEVDVVLGGAIVDELMKGITS